MMKSKLQAVTIQDVAKASGVSVSTVSRVLNGKVDVAQKTQEKVLAVIDELNYTSNLAARSMRGSKANLIGLIMPDVEYPYAIEIMKGVNQTIANSEYAMLVYTTGDVQKMDTSTNEQKIVALLNNSITDGVILVAPATSDFVSDAPIVSIDPHNINHNYPAVHADNYQGALTAMEYVLSLGHTRIGFIAGRPELESANRRLMGYRDALKHAGIPYNDTLVVQGDFTTKTAIQSASQLLSLPDRPTAIFASNDQTALGVIEVANEMGLLIPMDFSLIGFDNIPEARFHNLTTVDQYLNKMGSQAAKMLIQMINNEPLETETFIMKTKLVIRDSCQERWRK